MRMKEKLCESEIIENYLKNILESKKYKKIMGRFSYNYEFKR